MKVIIHDDITPLEGIKVTILENEMDKLDELEKKYQELGAEIEKLKAEKDAEKWPQVGDVYYSVPSDGCIIHSVWEGIGYQIYHLASGNVHRTQGEAEVYKSWLTSPRTQARREVEMCDGFDPNGEYIILVRNDPSVQMDTIMDSGLRFTSEEQSQACIDKLGEEKIKVALGVIGNQ